MRATSFKAGFAALALLVAACGSGDVLIQDPPGIGSRADYYRGEFDYATRNGAIVTYVAGNPFGGPKDAFDQWVLALMQHQNRGVPAEFVPKADDRTDKLFKVVVAFNKPANIPNDRLCENPTGVPALPLTANLRMDAAFCYGDTVQSDTFGTAYGISGPDDPKFAELVRGVTNAMIPLDTTEENDKGFRLFLH